MKNIPFLSLKEVTALHGAEINEAVSRVVNGGWYLQGEENKKFETHFAEFVGSKDCVGCANGLDALIWIFRAYIEMGVMKPGDEVIVPAFTYVASAEVIGLLGLTPVMVDVDYNTFNVTVENIKKALSPKSKAIIPVHLFGQSCDMEPIMEIAKRHNYP